MAKGRTRVGCGPSAYCCESAARAPVELVDEVYAQRRRGRLTLELLPVAGSLEDGLDGLARLRADAQPVLRPVRLDVDERRLGLRVVLADLLDGAAVTLGAGVHHDDAVVRRTLLADALQTDLDCHVCGVSLGVHVWVSSTASWGQRVTTRMGRTRQWS